MDSSVSCISPDSAQERRELYKLFAALFFTLPDPSFVAMIKALDIDDRAGGATACLANYVREARSRSDDDLKRELRVDRARLLNGAVEQGARPPLESSYRGLDHIELLKSLNRLYRAWGYGFASSHSEQSDHIAKELGFMQMLCEREIDQQDDPEKLELIRTAEVEFANEHLGNWGIAFAKEAQVAARTDFYRAACAMLEAFLREEQVRLDPNHKDDHPAPLPGIPACCPLNTPSLTWRIQP